MADASNAVPRITADMQEIVGRIVQSGDGTTVALGSLSGNTISDQSQVAFTRNSAGNYTLTIYNFGALDGSSNAVALVTASTTGLGYYCMAPAVTFSGSTATVTILAGSASPLDCTLNFDIKSYINI